MTDLIMFVVGCGLAAYGGFLIGDGRPADVAPPPDNDRAPRYVAT